MRNDSLYAQEDDSTLNALVVVIRLSSLAFVALLSANTDAVLKFVGGLPVIVGDFAENRNALWRNFSSMLYKEIGKRVVRIFSARQPK